MRNFWIFIFLACSFPIHAQETFRLDQHPEVDYKGKTLPSPFAGGINSAQIQTIDLTGDQVEEWVIWDINSRQLLVFKQEGESFIHLPELSYFFPPDISGFLVLADYDLDGKKDLFTATALGIKAYKNTSSSNQISWQVAHNFLRLDGSANIQTNNLDTPLIQDLDGDGDLDLVIFNFAGGDYMEFYKNTSIERKGSADVDGFASSINHWGNFEFCGCGKISFGKTCSGRELARSIPDENSKILHAGGHSILYQDLNNDGIEDLVLGRDECDILYYLPNSGTSISPLFNTFSNSIPEYGELPKFPLFHIGQLIDDELIISLNTSEQSNNYAIDFANSIVKKKRDGSLGSFLLQDQMLDFGENAKPLYIGNKDNGVLTIISNRLKNGEVIATAAQLNLEDRKFQYADVDNEALENLKLIDAQLLLYNDKSGVHRNIITGISTGQGSPTQKIYLLNGNSEYEPLAFIGYQPQRGDYLQFFNYENEDFLLVAAQNGSLDLYRMDFESLKADLVSTDFLGFVDNPANRNLAVAVENTAKPNLYAIDQNGILIKITDFMNSDTRSEVFIQIEDQKLPTKLGRNTWITLVNSPLSESTDLILGTRAGGLIYLASADSTSFPDDDYHFKVYPNPTEGPIKIITNAPAKAQLINALGQTLMTDIKIPANTLVEIQAGTLASGLYILNLEIDGKVRKSSKIWIR